MSTGARGATGPEAGHPTAPPDVRDVVYCHGFASSPGAAKAAFFRERLAPLGVRLHAPDLNVPTFESLRLTAQVERVADFVDGLRLPAAPAVIGSSMGALVALLFAARRPAAVLRLLLLAPAFRFVGERLAAAAGSTLDEWRARGWIAVPHHADGQVRRVGFQLVEDARGLDFDALAPPVPTMVVHGSEDEVIPVAHSEAWVAAHPGVTFHRLEGADHGLVGAADEIWRRAAPFLLGG